MNPKFSVIIPNYNHSDFLAQRLESVFNQTFQDFEVILLDDKSTDDSVAILEKYARHSKVSHFIVNEKNSGSPFKQWQKGIQLAHGKYIWIAESDDFCEPIFLENLIEMLSSDVVLAFCNSINVNQQGEKLGINTWAMSFDKLKWKVSYVNDGKSEIKTHLRYRNCIPNASAVIFKRDAVEDLFFEDSFYFCGDWSFWLKLLHKGQIAYLNRPLNYFRKHAVSTRVIKDYENEKKRFQEYYSILSSYSSFWNLLVNYKKCNWIAEECLQKSNHFTFKQVIGIKMPVMLKFSFLNKYFKLKFNKKL
ncbi:glycosyltransferase family 2 protein [Flavobacterium sp. 245]|uniref:glycosyltransferase family 2 protein n=1 Tax=Flavobacterium sp. 245 TaxID=2512115 RepID=UPI00105E63A5|nr:glycosyltransferase [Flavobacterium sp. 245]TDP00882.1 glycosyltransferase involved in cell wall biosynthesis [Flavobacterium sp. 245]